MRSSRKGCSLALWTVVASATPAVCSAAACDSANPPVNPPADCDATLVHLRTSCLENGDPIPNCFTTTPALTDWITNIRRTGAGPLAVHIGAGRFEPFYCTNMSDISLRGAGRGITTMSSAHTGLFTNNCFGLHVQDMTLQATSSGIGFGVNWAGAGSSTWTNTEVIGGLYGWSESCGDELEHRPVHKWFASEIRTLGKTAYAAGCSENWFTGSEITAEGSGLGGALNAIHARKSVGQLAPEIHIYGSVVRVIASESAKSFGEPRLDDDGTDANGIVAIFAGADTHVHVHGTGIDVIGNATPNDVAALLVANGGMIHANESSFVLQTPAPGLAHRIKKDATGGVITAPYQWDASVLAMRLMTEDGADTTVELVSDSAGIIRPRTLAYSSTCNGPGGPWYDPVARSCR